MALRRLQAPVQPVEVGVVVMPTTMLNQTRASPFAILDRVDGT